MPRQLVNDFAYHPDEKRYLHASGSSVFVADIPGLTISSQDIRKRRAGGHSVTYLVPEAVEDYMKKHELYQHLEATGSR